MDELRVEIETLKACNSKLESCALKFNASFSDFSFGSSSNSEASSILGGIQAAISRCAQEINYLYAQHFMIFNSYVNDLTVLDKVLSGQSASLNDAEANSILNDLPSIELDNDVKFDKDWDSYIDSFDETFKDIMSKGGSSEEVYDFVNYANNQMAQIYNQIQSGTLSEEEMNQAIEQYNEWYEYANKWAAGTAQVLENEQAIDAWDDSIIDEYKKFLNSNVYTRDYDGYTADISNEMIKIRNEIKTNQNLSVEEQNLLRKKLETYRQIAEQLGRGYGIDLTAKQQLNQVDIDVSNVIKSGVSASTINQYIEFYNSQITSLKDEIKNGNLSETEIANRTNQIYLLSQYSQKLNQGYKDVYSNDKKLETWINDIDSTLKGFSEGNISSNDILNSKSEIFSTINELEQKKADGKITAAEENLLNKMNSIVSGNSLESLFDQAYNVKNGQEYSRENYSKLQDDLTHEQANKIELENILAELKKSNKLGTSEARYYQNLLDSANSKINSINSEMVGLAYSSQDMLDFALENNSAFKAEYENFEQNKSKYENYSAELQKEKELLAQLGQQLSESRAKAGTSEWAFYQDLINSSKTRINMLNKDVADLAYSDANMFSHIYQNDATFKRNYDDQIKANNELNAKKAELDELVSQTLDYEKKLQNTSLASWEVEKFNTLSNQANNKISELMNELGYGDAYLASKTQSKISGYEAEINLKRNQINQIKSTINYFQGEQRENKENQIKEYEKEIARLENLVDKKTVDANQLLSQFDELANGIDVNSLNNNISHLQNELKNNPYLTLSDINMINSQIQQNIQQIAAHDIYMDLSKMTPDNLDNNLSVLSSNVTDDFNSNGESDYLTAKKVILNSMQNSSIQTKIDELDNFININNISAKYAPSSDAEKIRFENSKAYEKLDEYYLQMDAINNEYNDYVSKLTPIYVPLHELPEIEIVEEEPTGWEAFCATIVQGAQCLWWGIENVAESVVDLAVTASTGITSIGTAIIDGCCGNFGEPDSLTVQLYNDLDTFVSTDWVGNAAESIYDTDYGRWVDRHSLFTHDSTAAQITKGVGEAVGTICFGQAIGAKVGSINGITDSATLAYYSKVGTVAAATMKGAGSGLEFALNDGANFADAMAYGIASGAWEGTQWTIGMGINSATNAMLSNSTSALKSGLIYAGSIAADSIDSAIEGFVQPALKMFYDNRSYEELFEENGGWDTVAQQALIGGIMSAIGTAPEFATSLKQSDNAIVNSISRFASKIGSKTKDLYDNIAKKLTGSLEIGGIKNQKLIIDSPLKVSGHQDAFTTAVKALNPKFLLSPIAKYLEMPILKDAGMYNKAMDQGLLHFTSLDSAKAIVDSGYILPTKSIPGIYENNKAYMFAGNPSYAQLAINMDSSPTTVMTAVRIKPTDVQLMDLNFRYMDDLAVSHKGKFEFDPNQAEVVYFGITKDADGNLMYKEITEEMAQNYDTILAEQGIPTKTVGHGSKMKTVVDGVSNLDALTMQNDLVDIAAMKVLAGVDTISNNIISFVAGLYNKLTSKITQSGLTDIDVANGQKNYVTTKLDIDVTEKLLDIDDHNIPKYFNDATTPHVSIDERNLSLENINSLTNNYISNLNKFALEGISFRKYLEDSGINVTQMDSIHDLANYFGDYKIALYDKIKSLKDSPSLTKEQQTIIDALNYKISKGAIADIDSNELLDTIKPFLSQQEVDKIINLANRGYINVDNFTPQQLASVFNYTAAGGFEINAWLNDIGVNGASESIRIKYENISSIQDTISGYYIRRKEYSNRIFPSSDGNIIDCLDSIIENSNYDNAIITYRGVKQLFDNSSCLNASDLRVGDSFSSAGYQSSSILFENCYSKYENYDIVLEIIVPPNSGTAAYIEHISGITNYNQTEMLIKRDAKMTVIGDVYKKVINGVEKTFVPVIVQ